MRQQYPVSVSCGVLEVSASGYFNWLRRPQDIAGRPGGRHSDEALLAVSFIFVVHFFNTHFRPEKFPMDTVIFTTGSPLEEFKQDRPREYQQLVESGQLEEMMIPEPTPLEVKLWKRLGFVALTTGLVLIVLIIYAMIFAYR